MLSRELHLAVRTRQDHPALTGEPTAPADESDPGVVEPLDLPDIVVGADEGGTACQCRGRAGGPGHGLARTGHVRGSGDRHDRPEERLARDARPVRALCTHQLGFHDSDGQTASVGVVGDVLTHRTGAEDHHVVLRHERTLPDRPQ